MALVVALLGAPVWGAGGGEGAAKGPANRLAEESSPYLLQHAHNPVDWYPWGAEAFAKARREDKPIFLSVGYSTCHWCHVMERESFESSEVAEVLNQGFVAIKVDREERPDLDAIYLNATQLVTGRGGWPNSLWLTPDKRPFYAGTYFPRPAFLRLLRGIADGWKRKRSEIEAQADRLTAGIARLGDGAPLAGGGGSGPLDRDLVEVALSSLQGSFDTAQGGFGGAPKFPPHQALDLLLSEHERRANPPLLELATKTLDAMARGGVHDHVGGGFHRYSTDARWFLPHFEKMLYDNGMLLRAYARAFAATREERFRDVAERLAAWVLREMTDEGGGFRSALDADSGGEEGTFYLWTPGQVDAVLGPEDGALFRRVYGITAEGTYQEEASGRRTGSSIPYLARPLSVVAAAEKLALPALRARLAAARGKLRVARAARAWPGLDDKVLASWNGHMIRGLAAAGRLLERPALLAAAGRAADFVLRKMRRDGRLLRTYRQGRARLRAYLDDYAFLGMALVELHEATGEERWLREAEALVGVLREHYRDEAGGGFFFTADDHEDLLIRSKDPLDSAEPSGNGVAAQLLVRLAMVTGDPEYRREARRILEAFRPLMSRGTPATQSLALALAHYLALPSETSSGAVALRVAPVSLELQAAARAAAPGGAIPLTLRLRVDEGWHVNAADPGDPDLVPTRLALPSTSPARLEDLRYPPGTATRLPFTTGPISLYGGETELAATLRLPTATGPMTADLALTTQACDDRRCLPPRTHHLALPVEVRAGAPVVEPESVPEER